MPLVVSAASSARRTLAEDELPVLVTRGNGKVAPGEQDRADHGQLPVVALVEELARHGSDRKLEAQLERAEPGYLGRRHVRDVRDVVVLEDSEGCARQLMSVREGDGPLARPEPVRIHRRRSGRTERYEQVQPSAGDGGPPPQAALGKCLLWGQRLAQWRVGLVVLRLDGRGALVAWAHRRSVLHIVRLLRQRGHDRARPRSRFGVNDGRASASADSKGRTQAAKTQASCAAAALINSARTMELSPKLAKARGRAIHFGRQQKGLSEWAGRVGSPCAETEIPPPQGPERTWARESTAWSPVAPPARAST